jgi:hypothetical protein
MLMARRCFPVLAVSALAMSLGIAIPAAAESLADADAKKILTPQQVTGPNWTIDPVVARNGFSRSYSLTTPYGNFSVEGDRRLTERLAELAALDTLEKVSKTDTFADALAKAGLAPLRFGRDLISNPVETTANLFEGVFNVFDRVGAEIDQSNVSRDGTLESLLGVRKARRELAVSLGVDPYTDFKPLDKGLDDVAGAMAAGSLSVTAAFSAIPGGAGVAVSGTATAGQLSNPIRDKSSAELAAMAEKSMLESGVDATTIRDFLKNPHYSPADQIAVAAALKTLKADGASQYVLRAAQADSVDKAKFLRARLDTMAEHSAKLGGLTGFVSFADYTVARNGRGQLVAVFPFDEIAWTPLVEKSFNRLTGEIVKRGETQKSLLATTGPVSAEAAKQLTKMGWQIVKL